MHEIAMTTKWELTERQKLPLDIKINMTKERVKEWYKYWNGRVYVAFSGGKDSTVLLHIVRNLYPDVPAAFCDTGLEYPEIRNFVKTFNDVVWIKPKMNFKQVLEKYGYPVISKEQSQYIYQYRNAKSEKTKDTRWNGNKYGRGKISEKWKYMVDAPFKISDVCCHVMKKNPSISFEKEVDLHPMLGVMAVESSKRVQDYRKFGCNAFAAKRPVSRPIGFWVEEDIWGYIKKFNLPYSDIYNKGESRTGCMFCAYGLHMNKDMNKFQRMYFTHRRIYDYCINNLGMKKVFEWYKVNYKPVFRMEGCTK